MSYQNTTSKILQRNCLSIKGRWKKWAFLHTQKSHKFRASSEFLWHSAVFCQNLLISKIIAYKFLSCSVVKILSPHSKDMGCFWPHRKLFQQPIAASMVKTHLHLFPFTSVKWNLHLKRRFCSVGESTTSCYSQPTCLLSLPLESSTGPTKQKQVSRLLLPGALNGKTSMRYCFMRPPCWQNSLTSKKKCKFPVKWFFYPSKLLSVWWTSSELFC